MITSFFKTHSVPVFEGAQSRRHRNVPVGQLTLRAALYRMSRFREPAGAPICSQFVGFPRSGHSLVGSILDAHPEAVIAHELDAMGLLAKGMSPKNIYALMRLNSAAFSQHDRYWNGFSYVVPGQQNGAAQRLKVIGDKKGDWAARRIGAESHLLDLARERFGGRCVWILVARNPYDNIATMSLRKGRLYDRLRIQTGSSEEFQKVLKTRQEEGEIPAFALDQMIDDYESLCGAIEMMKQRVSTRDWHEVHYEAFTQSPQQGIRDLLEFHDLEVDQKFVNDASTIVHHSRRKSRDALQWRDDQNERVQELIHRFSFLNRFANESESAHDRS